METTQLVLLALAVGLIIGGAVSTVIAFALAARRRALDGVRSDVPDGVRAVLAGLDEVAVVVDASATIVATSPPARPFGLRVGEVVSDDEIRRLAQRARDTDGAESATLRLHRPAPAGPRLAVVRASSLGPRLTLVVVRDVTDRARVEQMRRDFVANTSHELKTPVGAVTLLSEAVESAADDPDQVRVFARRLQAEASRLGLLTSRILNLSRLQASDELEDVREVVIDEVVTGAIEAHAVQATSAGVTLVRGGERGLRVRGDAQILVEALGNLVANAIAYSPTASSVGIGARSIGDVVEIAVTDRGIGIREDEQDRVFERFYRADQARSRRTGGSGLGLAIVKHAVQRHGGDVRLWSRLGHGSTFTIRLPLADAAPASARKRKKRTTAAATRPLEPAARRGDA